MGFKLIYKDLMLLVRIIVTAITDLLIFNKYMKEQQHGIQHSSDASTCSLYDGSKKTPELVPSDRVLPIVFADIRRSSMASVLPASSFLIFCHICSSSVISGCFWLSCDGYSCSTHWCNWSIYR